MVFRRIWYFLEQNLIPALSPIHKLKKFWKLHTPSSAKPAAVYETITLLVLGLQKKNILYVPIILLFYIIFNSFLQSWTILFLKLHLNFVLAIQESTSTWNKETKLVNNATLISVHARSVRVQDPKWVVLFKFTVSSKNRLSPYSRYGTVGYWRDVTCYTLYSLYLGLCSFQFQRRHPPPPSRNRRGNGQSHFWSWRYTRRRRNHNNMPRSWQLIRKRSKASSETTKKEGRKKGSGAIRSKGKNLLILRATTAI